MKITSIDVIRLTNGHGPVKGNPWFPTVVRVNTDEGIGGIGEIGLGVQQRQGGRLRRLPGLRRPDYRHGPHGERGHLGAAVHGHLLGPGRRRLRLRRLSAIDIALWDIRGKALGVPSTSCWAAR